jgi:hypothetical protein
VVLQSSQSNNTPHEAQKKVTQKLTKRTSVMAAYFGVSTAKIRTVRDEHNLPLRRKKVVYDKNEFKQLFNDGIIYSDMAQQLGMSWCSVTSIKKQLNLPNRHILCPKVSHTKRRRLD